MKNKILYLTTILILITTFLSPTYEKLYADEENILFSSDFEDENIDDWSAFGGSGVLSLYSAQSHTGERSLKISGRTSTYNGPSINGDTMFTSGETYTFHSWVRQDTDSTKNVSWTMRYIDSLGGAPTYAQIANADVEPGVWTEFSGTLTTPDDIVSFLIYFECSNAECDFLIDDVSIIGKSENENNTSSSTDDYLYNFNFENSTESWLPRGDNRLIRTDEAAHHSSYSIYTTNRTRAWNGPSISVDDIKREVSYFYSAYVMYNGSEYEDSHTFRIEIQYNLDGNTIYSLITSKKVKKDEWTRINGHFTVPENAKNVCFYVQTDNPPDGVSPDNNDLLSFYLDDVTVAESSVIHARTAKISLLILCIAIPVAILIYAIALKGIEHSQKRKTAMSLLNKDAMTHAFNRNAYETKIAELEDNIELCKSLYYVFCDVNFLKYINDNLGHENGDDAIMRCATSLIKAVGDKGDVYRTGGDEFVCITTENLEKEIRKSVKEESAEDKGYPFEIALGFTHYDKNLDTDTPDIKKIMERCDKIMYQNKQEIKSKNKNFSRK